jgi:hypothetical protein
MLQDEFIACMVKTTTEKSRALAASSAKSSADYASRIVGADSTSAAFVDENSFATTSFAHAKDKHQHLQQQGARMRRKKESAASRVTGKLREMLPDGITIELGK